MDCSTREGNGNPLQYSCLENPVDRGAWWAAVYGVAQSWTRLKQLSLYAWTAAHQASLSITNSRSLLKLMSIASVMPSNHLILYHPLSSCLQSFPESGSFPVSQLFALGGQSIGASASVLPMNIQDWFHFRLTGLIFLQSKGLSRVFSNATAQKHQFFSAQPSLQSNSHNPYMTTGKTITFTRRTFVDKVMSLPFHMLSKLVITFLPRSKHLFISWLQLPSAVILEHPPAKKSDSFHCFPIYFPWSDGTGCHDLRFLNVEL